MMREKKQWKASEGQAVEYHISFTESVVKIKAVPCVIVQQMQ